MNKMNVKLIALDLDDTLLKHDLTISDYTVDILQAAAQKGIYIVLASGRTDNAILPYIRRLDIAGTQQGRFMISQNGTNVFDLHARLPIYTQKLQKDTLIHIHRAALEAGFYSEVYNESTIFVQKENPWTEIDVKLSGLQLQIIPDFEDFLQHGYHKMIIPGEPQKLLILQDKLRKELNDRAVIYTSKPYFLEFLPPNAGKGEALEFLGNHLNITKESIMAFGDSYNDESMIRFADYSVAMCNGLQDIQKIARYITDFSNDEDGTARFIEKHIL